tara:strand:- start:1036 stop:1419 length:384 start_codon:yes stop_codon:yes gene_type:complete
MSFWTKFLSLLGFGSGDSRIVAPYNTTVGFTGSMKPAYLGGEKIRIVPADFDSLQVGDDIVAYWESRRLNVFHRILSIRDTDFGRGYVTKGLNNTLRDAHIVTKDNFVGKVIRLDTRTVEPTIAIVT